jgi:hypothetical protein
VRRDDFWTNLKSVPSNDGVAKPDGTLGSNCAPVRDSGITCQYFMDMVSLDARRRVVRINDKVESFAEQSATPV